jgi:hypothetical protein
VCEKPGRRKLSHRIEKKKHMPRGIAGVWDRARLLNEGKAWKMPDGLDGAFSRHNDDKHAPREESNEFWKKAAKKGTGKWWLFHGALPPVDGFAGYPLGP